MNQIKKNDWHDENYVITTIQKGKPDDLYISCISYEPRTTGALRKLSNDYSVNRGLFLINKNFEKFKNVEDNRKFIKNQISRSSICSEKDCLHLHTLIDNPIGAIIEIDKIIKNHFDTHTRLNVTLDMTTFQRGQLLAIIYYLRHLPNIDTLRVLYMSPQKYGDWLTQGYKYSTVPPFFEGPSTFEKQTALFILTGFEFNRTLSMIDDIEPAAVILGRPEPGTSEEFKDISENIIDRLRKTRNVVTKINDISARNPFLCKAQFEEVLETYSPFFDFFVAVMGTKLQILGIYLAYEACKQKPTFRIIYPTPQIYNIGNYSSGFRDVYEIILKSE